MVEYEFMEILPASLLDKHRADGTNTEGGDSGGYTSAVFSISELPCIYKTARIQSVLGGSAAGSKARCGVADTCFLTPAPFALPRHDVVQTFFLGNPELIWGHNESWTISAHLETIRGSQSWTKEIMRMPFEGHLGKS